MSRCNRHGRDGCLCPDGAYTREQAQRRAGLCEPPPPVVCDRDRLTARLTYLAVGLTDAGLSALVERAETLTVDHARPLTSGALAKAQQEREAAAETPGEAMERLMWNFADPSFRASFNVSLCEDASPECRAFLDGIKDPSNRKQWAAFRAYMRHLGEEREARETAEAFKPPAKPLGQRFTETDAEIQRGAAPVEQAAPMAGKICIPSGRGEAAPKGYTPGCTCVPGEMCPPCRRDASAKRLAGL